MKKTELRREFLARRRALTLTEVRWSSQRIAEHFFEYAEAEGLTDEPACVHSFLPIRRHNEVDTWPIIARCWTQFPHIDVSVPVTEPETHRLISYTITADTPLVENKLGISEPAPKSRHETLLQRVKVVLVPLLIFDRQGQRVGYGGGYYDRFLAREVPNSRKVGLSLFEPVDRITDVELTDVRLDACLTPMGVYRFA